MIFSQTALVGAPRVADPAAAALGMARLRERAATGDEAAWVAELEADPVARPFLEGIFANSPFLGDCILGDVPFLRRVLRDGPDATLGEISNHLKDHVSRELDEGRVRRELRVAKRRVALTVALADLSGHWLLERFTHALADFADVAVSAAISHLLLREAEKGELVLPDPHFPEDGCGYFAIAMGKHGARELNYSSDIDLIVLYDPIKVDYRGRRSPQETFIRMTQRLVSILQERSEDGYVFRVDLNLRPDPRSTPVALPIAAARAYYATRGQNWERAAMIKARSCAGDVALGTQFLSELEPFVWRDHLDYGMIRDIRSIKRRLNAERGGGEIAFHGHNVKLGRGGIREIEFFAQTQQLILGGRDPYLRCLRTVETLTTLAESGAIDELVTDELTEAYEVLRQVEHRLQMVADEQTQTLPTTDEGMRRLAAFMGFDDLEAFRDTVLHHLRRVEVHYAAFFDDERAPAPPPAAPRFAALPIARDARSRELLAELGPVFVDAAASRPEPEEALAELEAWLGRLQEGVRSLSLLAAHPQLAPLLLDIVTMAPAVADELCRWPERLEQAASSSFFALVPDRKVLVADCAEAMRGRADPLAAAARWANEQRFQIAAHVVRQTMTADAVGRALANVADAVVGELWRRATADLDEAPAIVRAGTYAARELTLGSPLALGFAGKHADQVTATVFPWLTTETAHGRLYDVAPAPAGPWDLRARIDDLHADDAHRRRLRQIESFLGAALPPGADPEAAPAAVKRALCAAGDAATFDELRAVIARATPRAPAGP